MCLYSVLWPMSVYVLSINGCKCIFPCICVLWRRQRLTVRYNTILTVIVVWVLVQMWECECKCEWFLSSGTLREYHAGTQAQPVSYTWLPLSSVVAINQVRTDSQRLPRIPTGGRNSCPIDEPNELLLSSSTLNAWSRRIERSGGPIEACSNSDSWLLSPRGLQAVTVPYGMKVLREAAAKHEK